METLSKEKQAIFNDNLSHLQSGCVEWGGEAFDSDGTPLFYHNGLKDARRLVLLQQDGEYPVGKIQNICQTPFCLNPEHIVKMTYNNGSGVIFLNPDKLTGTVDCQPRETMDMLLSAEYGEGYRRGDPMPPVVAFYDGTLYWLADGYHRREGAILAGELKIAVQVYPGGRRDAVLYSVGANADHGKRRSNEDKRKAVRTLLEDEEWSQWSNREIARRAKVSPDTVDRMRIELVEGGILPETGSVKYLDRDGVERVMSTGNIGKSQDSEPKELTFHAKVSAIADAYQMTKDGLITYLVDKAYNDLQAGLIPTDVKLEA